MLNQCSSNQQQHIHPALSFKGDSVKSQQVVKLCARHRLPSTCCSASSSSENDNSIKTVSIKNVVTRRKYSTSFCEDTPAAVNQTEPFSLLPVRIPRNNTIHVSSSLPSTNKFFDRIRTEKKLRRYQLHYNNSIRNNDKTSSVTTTKTEPINIPKSKLNASLNSSSCDNNKEESYSEESDIDVDHRYELVNTNKKIRSIGEDGLFLNRRTPVAKNASHFKQQISTVTELNLNFSRSGDANKIKNDDEDDDDDNMTGSQKDLRQTDFDNYLEKFELNVFGSIDD